MSETTPPADRSGVPAELIRSWSFGKDPDAYECPFRAMSKLHDGPDIFLNTEPSLNVSAQPGGTWVVTRFELQREIQQRADIFSNKGVANFSALLGEDWPLIPLELDAPDHVKYRAMLNPLFSPSRFKALEPQIRQSTVDLIEKFRDKGRCEFVQEFGRPLPIGVFLSLMGLPFDQMETFVGWAENTFRGETREIRAAGARAIKDYLTGVIEDRKVNPSDDIIGFLVKQEFKGEPLTYDALIGITFLLFVGGLDTVAATLGFAYKALAEQPELQRQLRADPSLIPNAVQEILRAFGVVNSRRLVAQDVEFHGLPFKKGDSVDLPFALASRDPQQYPDPHKIDFMREDTVTLSFAAGPHRCIGSHLAQIEIRIALEEWIARVPEFRINPDEKTELHLQGVLGVDRLPLIW